MADLSEREWGVNPFLDAMALFRLTDGLGLPIPRLQLIHMPEEYHIKSDDGDDSSVGYCYYVIVFACDEYDMRVMDREIKDHCTFGLLGYTKIRSSVWGDLSMPFRDGAHAKWDSKSFGGLPIYVSCGREYRQITSDVVDVDKQGNAVKADVFGLNSQGNPPATLHFNLR